MKHALGVAVKVGDFGAVWVFPEAQLVLAEAVGTEDLTLIFVPDKRADLAVCVDCVDELACLNVPEAHGLVRSSSSGCQQVALPGTPRQGLDCRLVPEELVAGSSGRDVPNEGRVVIAA
jgi:hypothetical protein